MLTEIHAVHGFLRDRGVTRCGIRDLNPGLHVGNVMSYHWTNAAYYIGRKAENLEELSTVTDLKICLY